MTDRQRYRHGHWLALLALWGLPATAQTESPAFQGEVRLTVDASAPIWQGQQIELNLELLTTGLSFSGQRFVLPPVNGALLLQIDTTTIKLSERRGNTAWQVLRYPIALFALRSGELTVPSFEVGFNVSAGYGQPQQAFSFTTEPVTLEIAPPPGTADPGLLVTTSQYSVDGRWSPALTPDDDGIAHLTAGDAITLTVEQSARDISGMVLPAFPVYRTAGLSAYPEAPEIKDRTSRGELTGSRRDVTTWIVERAGRYELPQIRYRWFDPLAEALNTTAIPGQTLQVIAAAGTPATERDGAGMRRTTVFAMIVSLVLAAVALRWWWVRRSADGQGPRRHAEPPAAGTERKLYYRAIRACHNDDARETYAALSGWLGTRSGVPGSSTLLGISPEDEALTEQMESLQRAVVDRAAWHGAALAAMLPALRERVRARTNPAGRQRLVDLNPTRPAAASTAQR